MLSRVISTGRSEFLIASARAMVVAEFLERSPMRMEKSAFLRCSDSSSDFASEPESVDGNRLSPGRLLGNLFLSASGRSRLTDLTGKLEERYSAFCRGAKKPPECPPMMLMVPVFCSGMFQARLLKSSVFFSLAR